MSFPVTYYSAHTALIIFTLHPPDTAFILLLGAHVGAHSSLYSSHISCSSEGRFRVRKRGVGKKRCPDLVTKRDFEIKFPIFVANGLLQIMSPVGVVKAGLRPE